VRKTLAFAASLIVLAACQSVQTHDDGKAWGTPEHIGAGPTELAEALRADVAVDATGNALAVWDQAKVGEPDEDVWSNRYSASGGAGWVGAQRIETDDAGPALYARVAMDPTGNAVVVWQQENESGLADVWWNQYTAELSWREAAVLDDSSGNARAPAVAMDSTGAAVAVWYQSDGAENSVYSSRLAGGAWSPPEPIEDQSGSAQRVEVAMAAEGDAIAVWQHQKVGGRLVVYANRADVEGWLGPERPIDFEGGGDARQPHVAMDADGNAVAVWQQFDGVSERVWSNRFAADAGDWGGAEVMEAGIAGDATSPRVAASANGTVVAVWSQFDGREDNIWANRYAPDLGWGIPEPIGAGGGADTPEVAMDPQGDAVVVWAQPDGSETGIWSNRYTSEIGWGTAERIDARDLGSAEGPQVAIDANGDAVAVWVQLVRGLEQVWANRLERRTEE
jgi:hypothetical protein